MSDFDYLIWHLFLWWGYSVPSETNTTTTIYITHVSLANLVSIPINLS